MLNSNCPIRPAAVRGRRAIAIALLTAGACLPAAVACAQWDNLPRQEPGGTPASAPKSSWWGSGSYQSHLPQAAPAPPRDSIWSSWFAPSSRSSWQPQTSTTPSPTTTASAQPASTTQPQRLPAVTDAKVAQAGHTASTVDKPASRPWFESDLWGTGVMPGASIMRGNSASPSQPSATGSAGPVAQQAAPVPPAANKPATMTYNGSGLPGVPLAHWQEATAPEPAGSPSMVAEPMPHADGEDYDLADYEWTWQVLPQSLIYHTYLAGVKEPRLAAVWNDENRRGWILDLAAGARMGLLRYGTRDVFEPDGWQLDIEGAAFPRLDPEENMDMEACDFKFGVPLTYGWGAYQMKFAYSHLSSHLGDEFAIRNGLGGRLNYSRDALVWGHSYYFTTDFRLYFEFGYALFSDVSEPWDTQFGIEYSPICNGRWGAPFAAFNTHLRQEVNFGGNFVLQAGWQWTSQATAHRVRAGIQYYNGQEEQYEFFSESEQKFGFGLWYDF